MHIHQPALNVNNGKYYNIYGHQATTEDPNTSGYAHGVSTGVKLLTSLLNMDLRIVNAPANDVKINKIVLTTENKVAGKFNVSGNLINTGTVTNPIEYVAAAGSKAQFTNPWFASKNDGMTDGVTLSFDGVNTNVNGSTKGTMLLLPTNLNVNSLGTGEQPVLKVYTNYGIVTIGGSVADNDAQTNAIYKKDGIEKAAVNDNQALVDIIDNATNYVDKSLKVYRQDVTNKKQDYSINSGVSMTRVIKVDMAKAVMEGMEASTTEELNAILKAAVKNPNNKFTSSNKLEVKLIPNNLGQFTLTNYEGLDAFVTKFDLGALTLSQGNSKGNGAQLSTVVMNTTSVTVLKDVEGLADAVSLTIPATSAITSVKNGVSYAQHTITNPIVNKKTITLAQYSNVTIKDNTSGEFIYTRGASMDVTSIDTKAKYGKIYYKADTYNHMMEAADAGVNYIEVANVTNAFFNGIVDLSSSSNEANGTGLGGITVEFNNCGDLASTIEEGIKTQSIVLTNGTTYTNVYYAVVKEVTVKSANAKLGMGATNVNNKTYFDKITIAEGTTIIEQINVPTLEVKSGATATITSDCLAPTNLTVWGTASFAGSNGQTDQKVFVDANYNGKIDGINAITGTCIVTGSLELKNNLAYENVAVSATTNITVATGVKGLGYTEIINVTKAGQETATANLFTYHKDEVPAASMPTRYSWDGVATSTLQWN